MRGKVKLEVFGKWAGKEGPWRGAVDGTLNQTNLNSEDASIFDTYEQAEKFLNEFCIVQERGERYQFRIINI